MVPHLSHGVGKLLALLALLLAGSVAMPNDVNDWAQFPQQFGQALYPDGVVGSSPPTPSFTVNPNATFTTRFTLPTGATDFSLMVDAGGILFGYQLLVLGHQSASQYYGDVGSPGSALAVPQPTLPFDLSMRREWDSQLDVTVVNTSGQTLSVFASALFQPRPPGQSGSAQAVTEPVPSGWQAPRNSISLNISALAAGGTQTIVAAAGTSVIYVFGITVVVTRAGGGLGFSQFVVRGSLTTDFAQRNFLAGMGDAASTRFQYYHDADGAQSAPGEGLILKNTDTVVHDYLVTVAYTQL